MTCHHPFMSNGIHGGYYGLKQHIFPFTDMKKMDYLGTPLQIMNHWQANTILGARSSNLFLGVDLLGDASELSTVYMKPYTNDNVVRMKARMKAAVNYKFANEIFYLSA